MRLQDKVAIVTASTRGIGYATVEAFAQEGAIVYMAARNPELAAERIKAFDARGYRVSYVYNDAYRKESYRAMVDEVVEKAGRVDVLVNNFGTSDPRVDLDIRRTKYEDFLGNLDANLGSVYLASQAVIPHMARQGGGSIINISSIGGIVPDVAQISYGTSKAAINYLTKLIAVQAGRDGIRCNAVLPGMTATDAVTRNLSPEFQAFFLRHIPIQRMGRPEEIAAAAVYLAGDESAYTTGQILAVHGGFGMPTPVFADMADREYKR